MKRSSARRSARLVVLVLAVGGVAAGILATSAALAQGGAAGFTVHSSLDGKTVLPLRIHWIAHPQLPPLR